MSAFILVSLVPVLLVFPKGRGGDKATQRGMEKAAGIGVKAAPTLNRTQYLAAWGQRLRQAGKAGECVSRATRQKVGARARGKRSDLSRRESHLAAVEFMQMRLIYK